MARRQPPRKKGPAFDRSTGDWNVFQFSRESKNEQRAAKAKTYWDQIYKVKSDPAYFVRQLVQRAEEKGADDPRAEVAQVLGIARSTLGRALRGKGSTALIERSIKSYNRSEGSHKAARVRKWANIDLTETVEDKGTPLDQLDPKEKWPGLPKYEVEGPTKAWAITINGTLTFQGLKRTLMNFAVQAIKLGASMIVATVTVDMQRPGISPPTEKMPVKEGGWASTVWYPVRDGGKSGKIRWATGNEDKGYKLGEFLMNLDAIVNDLLRLPGITSINVYARQ